MGLPGNQIALVSDIGCSGLFDTFFHTHAFHGLHGRALTYATGIKMAQPSLNVLVTMGDGGLGIGGAHLLSACRRNLDLTLLVLNNFNFGMTGGQFSATTPAEAQVSSGFLNRLERQMDVCRVARSAGATYVARISGYRPDLPEQIQRAIEHKGFSIVDLWGICPGRYSRRNKMTPKIIEKALRDLPPAEGKVEENQRPEYGGGYRKLAAGQEQFSPPAVIEAENAAPEEGIMQQVVILGGAGQRIVTAGELLCYAGISAGLCTTQKNEYNITVLRGPSISEVILAPEEIGFTGIQKPTVIIALNSEGVARRKELFKDLDSKVLLIQAGGVEVPAGRAGVQRVDFKAQGIKSADWALASLGLLAKLNRVVSSAMLRSALEMRLKGKILGSALDLVERVEF
jgi:pyruvate/2-oxoacid:ferredoxin oxidoreductase beta subunit/Pyruvate/2-oxoacid:ferredoxin oxidoreductase gamma subunit